MNNCHVIQVKLNDVGNGPGIRTSVWVAGCSHGCEGCHNPETWKWKQGTPLSPLLIQKIIDSCRPSHIEGLTLTGGDPLFIHNRKGITELCKKFREEFGDKKTIWLWTGFEYEEVKSLEVIKYLDVLIDGKYVKELKDVSLTYARSKNQRMIQIKWPQIVISKPVNPSKM